MKPVAPTKGNTLDTIKQMEIKREERRKQMEELKKEKQQKKALNLASGKNVDIDFEIMIDKNRFKQKLLQPHTSSTSVKVYIQLSVCVRKRPIFKKEEQAGEIDAISCANPKIKIHEPKYKVDGITKYIENHQFTFDNTFNEEQSGDDIYKFALKPLIPTLLKDGIVTCFAYGQTGSGKTYTMNGIQEQVVNQLYEQLSNSHNATVSFFQIYGGRCYDLLNNKNPLTILEDKNNNIQIQGLEQKSAVSPKQLFLIMQQGNTNRTTHSTVANDTSSRSHSICQITVRKGDVIVGKLVLVDLAGSERAQDTQSNNRQRRIQGAEINKSLLALKQCIRAMDDKADHVPFRASKLTLVLRDSFVNKNNNTKVVMIACISPGSSSADHSLNTLRYADRLKDRTGQKLTQIQDARGEIPDEPVISKMSSVKQVKKQQPKPSINQQIKSQAQNLKPVQKSQHLKTQKTPPPKIQNKPEIRQRNGSLGKKDPKKQQINQIVSSKKQYQKVQEKDKQKQKEKQIDEEIERELSKIPRNKIRDDVRVMKQTMKYDKKDEFFDFHEKVTNILDQQQQIFATHMTAIKQDAKLLTQESQLISTVQGAGFIDYDIDSYVQKLQKIVKKKLKIYSLLSTKLATFKKNLDEQDEIRQKVKDTTYY